METMTAVACRWCGEAAQVLGDDGWLCDGCSRNRRGKTLLDGALSNQPLDL
jgi:hypothetical protein